MWGIAFDDNIFYVGSYNVNVSLIEMCFVRSCVLLNDSNMVANEYSAYRERFSQRPCFKCDPACISI